MTSADNSRKEAAFLFYWIPKAKQPTPSPEQTEGQTAQMSEDRICITCIGTTADMIANDDGSGDLLIPILSGDKTLFGEISHPEWKAPHPETESYACDRSVLLKLLEPMTSDWVRFRFGPGGVFIIDGNIGDKACAAYLAPRFDYEG